jgi:DNA repair and recombination RAD54-like protein
VQTNTNRHHPKATTAANVDKENVPPTKKGARLYGGTPQSIDRLVKPFKCPGSATPTRNSDRAPRKRRKISYADADGSVEEGDKPYTNEERLALGTRDANRYPVFKVKDKDTIFRSRFSVPLVNKTTDSYNSFKPPPILGMRSGTVFVAKALHDPSGEFAIVLYDPTIDNKPVAEEIKPDDKVAEDQVIKVDAPIVHKSLAEILGIKKVVEERPKVPVVIDPRLAKVLRPHQVEGVKVSLRTFSHFAVLTNKFSFFTEPRLASSTRMRMDVSWLTRWAWERQ